MQQAPVRLTQTIWTAFRAAKPVHGPLLQPRQFHRVVPSNRTRWADVRPRVAAQARRYSDKKSEIDRKAEDAKARIDDSLQSRAETAAQGEETLKRPQDETIIHTIPEASSIVHSSESKQQDQPPDPRPQQRQARPEPSLPSSASSRLSQLQRQFGHFMDNFQTHIFTASRRLNDLTGYSGIEALKNDIENQERVVQEGREEVKAARADYTDTIAKRSTTQREVNDLLHRKHTWSPTDLERFTSLYRSDHANEQSEVAAQKRVGDAEQKYEEASTKLAKAILARYHEEQIWSDKIRQMSTWGTWGLMGINVLLFVVFQLLLEPWRRRRLVKGFEEKVELAIKESGEERRSSAAAVQPNQTSAEAMQAMTAGERAEAVADHLASQIVDAVTGSSDETAPVPPLQNIESAAEALTTKELAGEGDLLPGSPDGLPIPFEPDILQSSASPGIHGSRWFSSTSSLGRYEDWLRARFSEDHNIMVSQRDLTTVAMEGVAGGMAIMGLLFVLLRPR